MKAYKMNKSGKRVRFLVTLTFIVGTFLSSLALGQDIKIVDTKKEQIKIIDTEKEQIKIIDTEKEQIRITDTKKEPEEVLDPREEVFKDKPKEDTKEPVDKKDQPKEDTKEPVDKIDKESEQPKDKDENIPPETETLSTIGVDDVVWVSTDQRKFQLAQITSIEGTTAVCQLPNGVKLNRKLASLEHAYGTKAIGKFGSTYYFGTLTKIENKKALFQCANGKTGELELGHVLKIVVLDWKVGDMAFAVYNGDAIYITNIIAIHDDGTYRVQDTRDKQEWDVGPGELVQFKSAKLPEIKGDQDNATVTPLPEETPPLVVGSVVWVSPNERRFQVAEITKIDGKTALCRLSNGAEVKADITLLESVEGVNAIGKIGSTYYTGQIEKIEDHKALFACNNGKTQAIGFGDVLKIVPLQWKVGDVAIAVYNGDATYKTTIVKARDDGTYRVQDVRDKQEWDVGPNDLIQP